MSKLLKISNQEEWKMKSPGNASALSILSVIVVVIDWINEKGLFGWCKGKQAGEGNKIVRPKINVNLTI